MKNYITVIIVVFALACSFAQVAVEKDAMSSDYVILEFNDQRTINTAGVAKGLVLPVSNGVNAELTEGSVWLGEDGIFKVRKATETFGLSNAGTVTATTLSETGIGTVVSDDGSVTDAKGVLELRSTTRAMILPHVNDVTVDLPNPQVGAWVYDVSKKAMAFYNGDEWEFNYGE